MSKFKKGDRVIYKPQEGPLGPLYDKFLFGSRKGQGVVIDFDGENDPVIEWLDDGYIDVYNDDQLTTTDPDGYSDFTDKIKERTK